MIGFVVAALILPMPLVAQGEAADTGYSARFVCPESLATTEAREAAAVEYVTWAQEAHPDWTVAEMMAHRMELLESHLCEAALANIRANEAELPNLRDSPDPWPPRAAESPAVKPVPTQDPEPGRHKPTSRWWLLMVIPIYGAVGWFSRGSGQQEAEDSGIPHS